MTVQEVNLLRRSVQNFDKNKEVDMELVKRVIDESKYAPSGYNLQPYRVIVVKSKEKKELLCRLAYNQEKVQDASVTLIIVADKDGYKRHNSVWDSYVETMGEEQIQKIIKGADNIYGQDESQKMKFAHVNTSLYSMTLMLLFKAYGMDTHSIGGMKENEIKKEFGITDSEDINMLLSVGYHDQTKELITRKYRKPLNEIMTII